MEAKNTQKFGHILVLANQKGGSGKSTIAVHIAVALMRLGFKVAALDFDIQQNTFSRYLKNRKKASTVTRQELSTPALQSVQLDTVPNALEEPLPPFKLLEKQISNLKENYDFIIVDTPGSMSALSRYAHTIADTLLTPINDSFVDLNVLAEFDTLTNQNTAPSQYSMMVAEQRKLRLKKSGVGFDWIVLRNRIGTISSKNNQNMEKALEDLSPKLGVRVIPGISERVIYRELFPTGLTVLDLIEMGGGARLNMSHIAARQEVRQLLSNLSLPKIDRKLL